MLDLYSFNPDETEDYTIRFAEETVTKPAPSPMKAKSKVVDPFCEKGLCPHCHGPVRYLTSVTYDSDIVGESGTVTWEPFSFTVAGEERTVKVRSDASDYVVFYEPVEHVGKDGRPKVLYDVYCERCNLMLNSNDLERVV